jgi:esterase/lipase superfamily enzyme
MNREYHCWYSEKLERDMELLVFGHAGAKVLIFPTREGRFYEYENLGLVAVLEDKINAGFLQLYCVDSIDWDTVYCSWRHPADRIQQHNRFEDYVLSEVMPFMAEKNSHACTIVHGCSLGAFHAANIAFRHPHLFQKLCSFSGRYDLTISVEYFHNLFEGYYDDNIYFNMPTHYLPQLECEWRLEQLRQMHIILAIGREDPFFDNNMHLSQLLDSKNIAHELHIWDGRAHRGRYWRQMAKLYI